MPPTTTPPSTTPMLPTPTDTPMLTTVFPMLTTAKSKSIVQVSVLIKMFASYVKYTLQKLEDDYEDPSRKQEVVQMSKDESKFLEFINKYMVRDLDKYLNIAQEEETNDLLSELI